MSSFYEKTSDEFLELASEIRLEILFELLNKRSRLTTMAKKFSVTAQEIHRNFERMINAGLVEKQKDNYYEITTFGKAICSQIPSIAFLSQNKEYFIEHDMRNLPEKFVRRIGDLNNSELITGVSRVLEKWKYIYRNADDYIFNVLYETPLDLIEVMIKRVNKGVKYKHIIAEDALIPKGRKKLLQKHGFYKLLESERIERRMLKKVSISVILNEKHAAVLFPASSGVPDIQKMFFSEDKIFRDWCLDYFKYNWNISDPFKEFKLKE